MVLGPNGQVVVTGGTTLLGWIEKYGLSTIVSVVLIAFLLWNNYITQEKELVLIGQINTTMAGQTRALEQMSASQSETTKLMAELVHQQQETTRAVAEQSRILRIPVEQRNNLP